ncbi:ATP-binding protein [Sphaerisporangium corydalis]|uniref:ATP-binding protein n=1 Tax=Sphaerisporangium corydalis TaxID=1441875 RepID=A0ABV9E8L2_9ACTN|nr:ATP-binding protein [Sphaerisporangium corydalis]
MAISILLGTAELRGTPSSVRGAREFVRMTLGEGHPALDDVTLLVSELVTNSVAYSDSQENDGVITLSIGEISRGRLHVMVTDDGSARSVPRRRAVELMDESGRGLVLLQALARRWGTYPDGTRRVVWFQIGFRKQTAVRVP